MTRYRVDWISKYGGGAWRLHEWCDTEAKALQAVAELRLLGHQARIAPGTPGEGS